MITVTSGYPVIPNEKGRDSLFYHSLSQIVLDEGEMFWSSSIFSSFGWTSVGQEIGIVSYLSALSLLTGVSVSTSILFYNVSLKLLLLFTCICISKSLRFRYLVILPLLAITSLYVLRQTEWVISTRFFNIIFSFIICLIILIVRDKYHYRSYIIRFFIMTSLAISVMLLTHRMYLMIIILFLLTFSFYYPVKFIRQKYNPAIPVILIIVSGILFIISPPNFWLNYYSVDLPVMKFGSLILEDNPFDNSIKILFSLGLFFGVLSPLCIHGLHIISKKTDYISNTLITVMIFLSVTLTEGIFFMHIYTIPVLILITISLCNLIENNKTNKVGFLLILLSLCVTCLVYFSIPVEDSIYEESGSSYILDETNDMALYSNTVEGNFISNSKEGLQISTINPSRLKIEYMREKPLVIDSPETIADIFGRYQWDSRTDVGINLYDITVLMWVEPSNDFFNKNIFDRFDVKYAIVNVAFPTEAKAEVSIRFNTAEITGIDEYYVESQLLIDLNDNNYVIYHNDYNKIIHI